MSSCTFALGPILVLTVGLAAHAAETPAGESAMPSSAAAALDAGDAARDASEPDATAVAPAAMPEPGSPAEAVTAETPAGEAVADESGTSPDDAEAGSSPAPTAMVDPEADTTALEAEPKLPGAVGYDAQGRQGWIHTVQVGDTLWDISDAYLGTPWVWPSIWQQNEDIANPHRIYPGDQIWITPTEMRRITPEEAARLLAGEPAAPAAPAAIEDALDAAVPLEGPEPAGPVLRYPNVEAVGLVTVEEFEAASSIVDSTSPYVWLTQGATVFIGLGDGEVEVGDEFTAFRVSTEVRDPETRTVLGHFVTNLGWIEIVKVHPEVSEGVVRASFSEMRRGDSVTPRHSVPAEIPLRPSMGPIEGRIVFAPEHRDMGAIHDFVFLNRGALHGLDVGNTLEVYRGELRADDAVRGNEVSLPDEIVAKLVVVSARPETSVAVVTRADEELETGDHFRTPME
ncbi:MAG: LysM peptidoglycan-binding domain-containing protein [Deltaproteobacteria bacterium]|nr:MAG: LysM peptidoglycan-binding domain-containing protein [Deltaproteobacteria bacterium]